MIRWMTLVLLLSASPLYAAPDVDPTLPPFKAVCDGVADDTAKLQAAILYADTPPFKTIRLPPSLCRTTDTLTFGNQPTRYSEISVYGHSEYVSGISYAGPADRPAIAIRHMAAFRWSRFAVTRAGSRGTTIGILLDGPVGGSSGGTMNTTITLEHVAMSGFSIGMLAGNVEAASEIDCRQCGFSQNDIGFTSSGYNALNFWFFGSHFGQNGIGIKLGGPWVSDGVHIVGGDSNGNTEDIHCENTFGVLSIQDFRAEIGSGRQFLGGHNCYIVTVRSSVINSPGGQVTIQLDKSHRFALYDSFVGGRIAVTEVEGFGSFISIIGTTFYDPLVGYPILLPPPGNPKGLYLDMGLNVGYYGQPLTEYRGRY